MNVLAMKTTNKNAVNQIFNVAFGERTTLTELANNIKNELLKFDSEISDIKIKYGSKRVGDIPHSLASIEKAQSLLNYNPVYDIKQGLSEAINWYWNNL
jgi:UDP-N-acetylglucosamine 4-epimerase